VQSKTMAPLVFMVACSLVFVVMLRGSFGNDSCDVCTCYSYEEDTARCDYTDFNGNLPSFPFRIKHISIKNNYNLEHVGKDFFSNVIWLWSVNITDSHKITSIDAGVFDVLINVSSIDISRNGLTTISSNIMNETTRDRLTHFDFRGQVANNDYYSNALGLICTCDLKWLA
jgi:hypothetical protein